MLQTFEFPAGGRQINAKATFFKYESSRAAGADDTIRLRVDGNDFGLYTPGDSIDLPDDEPMQQWEIVPVVGTVTGTVRVGMGRVTSGKLAGVVQVVDTAKSRTLAGLGFGLTGTQAAAVGFFARAGIWVPAAAKKRAVIERLSWSTSGAAMAVYMGTSTTAPPSLDAVIRNKLSGGAVPVAVLRAFDSNASASAGMSGMYQFLGATSGFIEPKTPIIVPPGFAFLAYAQTANQDLSINVDMIEEDNT